MSETRKHSTTSTLFCYNFAHSKYIILFNKLLVNDELYVGIAFPFKTVEEMTMNNPAFSVD